MKSVEVGIPVALLFIFLVAAPFAFEPGLGVREKISAPNIREKNTKSARNVPRMRPAFRSSIVCQS